MVIDAVERALVEARATDRTILVAVSGGVDSTVLLHALAELAPRHRIGVAVGHVHHGLRADEADADADAVRADAEALGIPFRLEHVEPAALREGRSKRSRPTLQEAARTLRYAALNRMADSLGAAHLATAHTLDDQAETVLMRLLRGTAPDGLAGIPERSPDGRIIRPLLGVSRAEIEAFARNRGVSWREDASNACDGYTRNRIRHHWLPGLAREFNPQLLRAIGRLAEAQRRDAEWIEKIVEQVVAGHVVPDEGGGPSLRARGWDELPEALARRVVRRVIVEAGGGRDVTRTHIDRVLAFLRNGLREDGPRTLELPGGLRIVARQEDFTIVRVGPGSISPKD